MIIHRRVLDTSILVSFWNRKLDQRRNSTVLPTLEDAKTWAAELQKNRRAKAILTPIRIEFICGAQSGEMLKLYDAFLSEFDLLDKGIVQKSDWMEAEKIARRVPREARRRQMGDCLIRAIANRLNYDVDSADAGFPFS